VFWIADDLLKNIEVEKRKETFYSIEEKINEELHKHYPKIIEVCAEEVLLKFVPSKAKKSYYRIE